MTLTDFFLAKGAVLDLSGGWGVQPPSGASQPSKFVIPHPENIVKISQKYIADPSLVFTQLIEYCKGDITESPECTTESRDCSEKLFC